MPEPPIPPGTKVDRSSDYFRYWPQGRPGLFKLKDNLILAVPPQYQQFWFDRDRVVRGPVPEAKIPQVQQVGFQFFMPDFSGYVPQNYRNEFDENQVKVIDLEPADPDEMEPDAPGHYPPNMLKRTLGVVEDPNKYEDMYGLRCYNWFGGERVTCYGRRDEQTKEDIMFYAYVPPYAPGVVFPIMQAEYFSNRYGGLHLVWRTHVKNMPRWHDIDAQIWKFIDSWNIALQMPTRKTSAEETH